MSCPFTISGIVDNALGTIGAGLLVWAFGLRFWKVRQARAVQVEMFDQQLGSPGDRPQRYLVVVNESSRLVRFLTCGVQANPQDGTPDTRPACNVFLWSKPPPDRHDIPDPERRVVRQLAPGETAYSEIIGRNECLDRIGVGFTMYATKWRYTYPSLYRSWRRNIQWRRRKLPERYGAFCVAQFDDLPTRGTLMRTATRPWQFGRRLKVAVYERNAKRRRALRVKAPW